MALGETAQSRIVVFREHWFNVDHRSSVDGFNGTNPQPVRGDFMDGDAMRPMGLGRSGDRVAKTP